MDNIQRAVSILLGGILVACLLINVRQCIVIEQLMGIEEGNNLEYPHVAEEEALEIGA